MATQPDLNSNDGWIEWAGGPCPVAKDCLVEIMLRSGETNGAQPARFWDVVPSWWQHKAANDAHDIIAYRVVAQ